MPRPTSPSACPAPLPMGWQTLAAFLCTAVLGLAAQWPGLLSPYVINDDVRQQLYWMARWREPGLYPPDVLSDYARSYVPWGVQGLYRLGALVADPLMFSKAVAVGLLAWLGGLVFACARGLGGARFGWFALGLFWLMPAFMENISGGLARAFAAPLLALFLHAQLSRSRPLALAALWAQALFIPYILPICLGAALLQHAAWLARLTRTEPLLRLPLDALLAAAALALACWWQTGVGAAGPLPWAAEMAGRPEFGPHGRFPIVPTPSLFWELIARPWGALAPFADLGTAAGVAASLALLPLMAAGARRVPWRDHVRQAAAPGFLLLSSVLLYFAARLLLLKLFIPSRYLEYSTNLLYCLGVPFLLWPLAEPLLQAGRRWTRWSGPALLALALVLGAARQYGRELYDYSGDHTLYEAARTTPKDALFAGHPAQMDNLLTFGRRNVYASYELAHPWSSAYWSVVGPRLDRLLRAYYAEDADEIRRFCAEAEVDFLVIDRRHFEPEFMRTGGGLFEPYAAYVRGRAGGAFAALSLASSPHAAAQVTGPDTIMVDTRGWR